MPPRRVFLLLVAAGIILASVVWKTRWEAAHRANRSVVRPPQQQLAPRFQLFDQAGHLVKFERYLGRTRLVLLFTDADPLDNSLVLNDLVEGAEVLQRQDIQPVVVTMATPFRIRESEQRRGRPYPFPIVADFDEIQPGPAHREWGCWDEVQQAPVAGLFLIDRAGLTEFEAGRPRPSADPRGTLRQVLAGDWPRPTHD